MSQSLVELLRLEIPISKAMGIEKLRINENNLELELPLAPNRNHKNTLFGGSLYSSCALACYALFLNGLQQNQIFTKNIVISDGQIKYLRPVQSDAIIRSNWTSVAERELFFQNLSRKQKSRATILAQAWSQDILCAEFSGRFVASI